MPKGFYPDDHKHPLARGKSINKFDPKGNPRKARKSRAKDPERFKKAVEEKTGLSDQVYKGSLLGKIVDKGIASGSIDDELASSVSLNPPTLERDYTKYNFILFLISTIFSSVTVIVFVPPTLALSFQQTSNLG